MLKLSLSGAPRLHHLCVANESMSHGEYRNGGAGLVISYGFQPTPFGEAIVLTTTRTVTNSTYLAGLGFVDDGNRAHALGDMQKRWPKAQYIHNDAITAPFISQIFDYSHWQSQTPLPIILMGTDFQVRVWETLLQVPFGCTTTYGALAHALDKPTASRAVGAAVGRNPISFIVPCHRVVGKNGALTGYHWGLKRKQAMLEWETKVSHSA